MTADARGSGYDVMVVGEYYFDMIFRGLPDVPRISADLWAEEFEWLPGGAFSTALALTRLGTATGWWCSFGNDVFSRMVAEEARREGIDDGLFIHLDKPLRRVSAAFSFSHDRGFISYAEPIEPLPEPHDLERIRPRILLLQGFSLDGKRRALIEAARWLGIIVCSDCQHVDMTLSTPGMVEMLGLIDVFLPNSTEAMAVTGEQDVDAALAALARHCQTVVIKCGSEGAVASHKGQIYQGAGARCRRFRHHRGGRLLQRRLCPRAPFGAGFRRRPGNRRHLRIARSHRIWRPQSALPSGSHQISAAGGRDITKKRRREQS